MATRKATRNTRGPQFIYYFNDVLNALSELGGSGRPDEVVNQILTRRGDLTEEESEQLSDGTPRIVKNIHWARYYLMKRGYIDGSNRGVWLLTDFGRTAPALTPEQSYQLFTEVYAQVKKDNRQDSPVLEAVDNPETATAEQAELLAKLTYRERALELLKNLPPHGFENFCKYLLRESGFEEVVVTGKPGDGGIDGWGEVVVNTFVKFRVAFQCKRYKDSVGREVVANFRGSIEGRADKGLILTTGAFTQDAKSEAKRDGAKPIELVDASKLLDLMEEKSIGLTSETRIVFDVDERFFDQFRQP